MNEKELKAKEEAELPQPVEDGPIVIGQLEEIQNVVYEYQEQMPAY